MDRIPNAPKAFYPIWAENALWTYRGRSASLAPRARPRHMGQRRYADTNTLWTHHAGRAGAHPYQPRAWPRHAVTRRYADTNALWTCHAGRAGAHPYQPRARPRHMGQTPIRRHEHSLDVPRRTRRSASHQPRAWPRHAVKRRTPTPTLRPGRFLRSKFAVDNRMIRATG